jgi:predicted SAM-dependent methyltransferase
MSTITPLFQPAISRLTGSYRVAKLRQLATRGSQIKKYYAQQSVIKVNIGCGPRPKEGWLNVDIDPRIKGAIYTDATRPLPLRNASVDFAYSEHMIEHIPLESAIAMLREIHRVLRLGGMVRIATPDLDKFLHLKNGTPDSQADSYVRWSNGRFGSEFERARLQNPCYTINREFHEWGHRFLYDRVTLAEVLSHSGFCDVTFCDVNKSAIPEFRNIEVHGTLVGENFAEFETMIAEARKS